MSDDDCLGFVGENLRRLRTERGLSLERLAHQTGVSRAMLGQIELGQSAPTIRLLWRIAHGLGVGFSALLTAPHAGPAIDRHRLLRRARRRSSIW